MISGSNVRIKKIFLRGSNFVITSEIFYPKGLCFENGQESYLKYPLSSSLKKKGWKM